MTNQRITDLEAAQQKAKDRARRIEDRIKAERAKLRDMMVTVCERDHRDWFDALERAALEQLEQQRLARSERSKAARAAKQQQETVAQGEVVTPLHAAETQHLSYTNPEGSAMSPWSNQ